MTNFLMQGEPGDDPRLASDWIWRLKVKLRIGLSEIQIKRGALACVFGVERLRPLE